MSRFLAPLLFAIFLAAAFGPTAEAVVNDRAFYESGNVTLGPNTTTATVTFGTAKSSASYSAFLQVTSSGTTNTVPYVSAKTTASFQVNVLSTNTTQTFDWEARVNPY